MSQQIIRIGDLLVETVHPGDLIKSDLINAIIQNLDTLNQSGTGTTGQITVPNTVGRTLAEAREIIANPTTHMSLGGIIDVTGQAVSAVAEEAQTRRVVNQVPVPAARVASGTAMSLVLSIRPGTGGGGTTPSDVPVITNVSSARIAESATITGNNFELAREDNRVFFAGTQAEVPLTASRTVLTVRVPEITIPASGGEVEVRVLTARGEATGRGTVLPRAEVPRPRITTITPTSVTEGNTLTVAGTGFGAAPTQNEVIFADTQTVRPTGGAAGSLTLVIPNNFSEVFNVLSGASRQLQVRVRNTQTGLTSDVDVSRSISFFMPLTL